MIAKEEQLALPEVEQDTNKYKKHINDLIEDAEIEAEMEAEKKIRSKNSRALSISIFSLGLLAVVYFYNNNPSVTGTISKEEDTALLKVSTESAEKKLAMQVPVLEVGSNEIPFENTKKPSSVVEPAKITFTKKTVPAEKSKVSTISPKKIKRLNQNSKPVLKRKEPVLGKNSTRFFVQTGAFSQKKNAETSIKKLQSKGFSPFITVLNRGNTKTYLVQLGVFPNREKAILAQEKLAQAGYAKTIIK